MFTSRPLCGGLLPSTAISSKSGGGVDPAVIAYDLGLHEVTVQTLQRKMGLRKCRTVPRKGDRHD